MEIRPYYKSELAQMYAPDITHKAALKRLNDWIRINHELYDALIRSGYTTNQRIFTTYQVRLIVEYLGEP